MGLYSNTVMVVYEGMDVQNIVVDDVQSCFEKLTLKHGQKIFLDLNLPDVVQSIEAGILGYFSTPGVSFWAEAPAPLRIYKLLPVIEDQKTTGKQQKFVAF